MHNLRVQMWIQLSHYQRYALTRCDRTVTKPMEALFVLFQFFRQCLHACGVRI